MLIGKLLQYQYELPILVPQACQRATNSYCGKRGAICFITSCYDPIRKDDWTSLDRPGSMTEGVSYPLEVQMPSAHEFSLENLSDSPQMSPTRISSSTTEEVSFLRLPEVKSVTGLSKSSLYALIRANSFPAPVQLGPRTVAWVRSEIKQWAAERITASRTAVPSSSPKRRPQRVSEPWPVVKKWA